VSDSTKPILFVLPTPIAPSAIETPRFRKLVVEISLEAAIAARLPVPG